MAEVLGLGMTEFPAFRFRDDARMLDVFARAYGRLPSASRWHDRAAWPEPMLAELSDDEGLSAARAHRAAAIGYLRQLRKALDEFAPDAVIFCLEDHYENFHEDILPPYCVLAYDKITVRPYTVHGEARFADNVWGQSVDTVWTLPGAAALGVRLAAALAAEGVEIPVSFAPLHGDEVAHPFAGAFRYLDWDDVGFPYPSVLLHVNAYGSSEVARHFQLPADRDGQAVRLRAPSPRNTFELGQALGRALRDRVAGRIAVVAGSSWSHASLAGANDFFFPDVAADQQRFDELRRGEYASWADVDLDDMEQSGQIEMLTWYPLVGLLNVLRPDCHLLEQLTTYLFNSTKVFAIYQT